MNRCHTFVLALSGAVALSTVFTSVAVAQPQNLGLSTSVNNEQALPLVNISHRSELAAQFPATVTTPEENVSILSISNAYFDYMDGDVVMFDGNGAVIENLSTTINSVLGVSIEIVNGNQVRTTIDKTQYPELQLKCGLGALAGGTGGLVATGLGLAAVGVVTGGAAFAILAIGGAAGYIGGAVQGGCFG